MPGPQLSPRAAVVVGLLFAAAGVTLVLGAIGVVPVPVSSGERHFYASMSLPFWGQQGPSSELSGRVAFGSGAVLMWIYLIAVGVSGARHLVREFRKR